MISGDRVLRAIETAWSRFQTLRRTSGPTNRIQIPMKKMSPLKTAKAATRSTATVHEMRPVGPRDVGPPRQRL